MKNLVPAIFGLFLMSILVSSCSKSTDTATAPKEQVVVGRWNINRMQLRIYYGGVFSKDTIVAQTPMPENFIQFDAAGNFQYRFNTTAIDAGTYQFKGADSIIAISPI